MIFRFFAAFGLLIFALGTSSAQEARFLIGYSVQDATSADVAAAQSFAQQLADALNSADRTIGATVVSQVSASTLQTSPDLLVTALPDGELLVQPLTEPLSAVSPLLYDVHGGVVAATNNEALPFGQAMAHYAHGRCDRTLTLLEGIAPDMPDAQRYIAYCAILQSDYAQAIDNLEAVQSQQFDDNVVVQTQVNLAWTYIQAVQQARAFEVMDEFVAATAPDGEYSDDSNHITALSQRAHLHALTFAFDPAIADASAAIELAELTDQGDERLARLYKQRGDHIFLIYEWNRVLADYDTAVELDATYADAYFARGVLYYTQGPRSLALPDFEQFLALAPQGAKAQAAADYIESIQVELDALEGDDTSPFLPTPGA